MSKCIVCNGQSFYKYCSIEKGRYDVMICKNCSLTFLKPQPTYKELEDFYRKKYRQKYSTSEVVTKDILFHEQERANRVLKIMKNYIKNSNTIIDIGCSTGKLLENLKLNFSNLNLYGIELNDNYRKYIIEKKIAKNITDDNIYLYGGGMNKEKFDNVFLVHVLEHLNNPIKALENIWNILKNDGYFYVEVPNLYTPYANLKKNYFAIYHLFYFNEDTLKDLLEISGFKIVEKHYIGTSISYICQKNKKQPALNIDENRFYKLIKKLYIYEIYIYPKNLLREKVVSFLELIGAKDFIKGILKR